MMGAGINKRVVKETLKSEVRLEFREIISAGLIPFSLKLEVTFL